MYVLFSKDALNWNILEKIIEKWITFSIKNINKYNCFIIKDVFLDHLISKLEWFLKDHVTLKTVVVNA